MRGVYSAAYLHILMQHYANTRGTGPLDFGKSFHLIAGTSTGGILACALAAGIPMERVVKLYRERGPAIFPEKVPVSLPKLTLQFGRRRGLVKKGAAALGKALAEVLGDETIGQIYKRRNIALAVPAVQMADHAAWVFKTAHLPNSKHRDDGYRLVDACMATSAAPVFRSLAWVKNPTDDGGLVFADGGLWANNPVLVALIDALELTKPGDRIEIYCLGTCPPPSGNQVPKDQTNWGFGQWRFGADVPNVAISAQQYAYDNMARMLIKHTGRDARVVRFPHAEVPPAILAHLDLDETSATAMDALVTRAQADVSRTLSVAGDVTSADGMLIDALLRAIPEMKETEDA
jgi:hypothetical protein